MITTLTFLSARGAAHGQAPCLEGAQQRWERVQSDAGLQTVQGVLLRRYAEFKQYPTNASDPTSVRETLSEDRYGVFDAVTRAMFTRLRLLDIATRQMRTLGRIMDYVYAVVGIWGVRLHDPDGTHAFRLTVVAAPELREILDQMGARKDRRQRAAETFGPSEYSHILLPACEGRQGDDDPDYSDWDAMPASELKTVRLVGRWPKMQISYWNERAPYALLEVDIDFHNPAHPFRWSSNRCHGTPSNSDPGVADHPAEFETRYRSIMSFAEPFAAPCTVDSDNHCAKAYESYCAR